MPVHVVEEGDCCQALTGLGEKILLLEQSHKSCSYLEVFCSLEVLM